MELRAKFKVLFVGWKSSTEFGTKLDKCARFVSFCAATLLIGLSIALLIAALIAAAFTGKMTTDFFDILFVEIFIAPLGISLMILVVFGQSSNDKTIVHDIFDRKKRKLLSRGGGVSK